MLAEDLERIRRKESAQEQTLDLAECCWRRPGQDRPSRSGLCVEGAQVRSCVPKDAQSGWDVNKVKIINR